MINLEKHALNKHVVKKSVESKLASFECWCVQVVVQKLTVNKYFCLSKKAFVENVNMSVPLCDSSVTNTAKHINSMGLLR